MCLNYFLNWLSGTTGTISIESNSNSLDILCFERQFVESLLPPILLQIQSSNLINTPGTAGGPGGRDLTLVVKNKKAFFS